MILQPKDYSAFKLIHEGILALGRAEQVGARIDVDYCLKVDKHLDRQITYYQEEFKQTKLYRTWKNVYGNKVNPASDPQLSHILFGVLKIEPMKFTENDNPSVDEEALSALDMPDIDIILKLRSLDKVKTTYIGGYLREQVDGVLRCFFNLHIPRTFRSSSEAINFQNQPNRDPELKKMCRKAIKARPGHKLLCADYSGAEIRGATCYHKDPVMIDYLLDESKDMHRDVAMDAFLLTKDQIVKPIRHIGKNGFVFAEFYGDWYESCAKNMWHMAQVEKLKDGTPLPDHMRKVGLGTLEAFIDNIKKVEDIFWNKRFKVYNQWKKDWYEEYLERGYIDLLSGFRCVGVMNRKECINYPIQGTSFHFLLLAFVILDRIQNERNWISRLILQIHDEVVMDVHPDEEDEVIEVVRWVMEKEVPRIFQWINVPLIAEIEITPTDGSWYDKVGLCKCGGAPEIEKDSNKFVMYCPHCQKETSLELTYDAAIKAWKDLK